MSIEAEFVTSAASAADLPRDGLPEIALVGRSNVGKSSLINALVRQRIARTSATPGKTRLVNIYRVARGGGAPVYLVDLPGYGWARGDTREFDELTRSYFLRAAAARTRGRESTLEAEGQRSRGEASASGRAGGGAPVPLTRGRESTLEAEGQRSRGTAWGWGPTPVMEVDPVARPHIAALLLVDARHPGLPLDRAAWAWIERTVLGRAVVATKIDKLARGRRTVAMREFEAVFRHPVLPASAVAGEGLKDLWILIDRLATHTRGSR